MAANTAPIFPIAPNVWINTSGSPITAANNLTTGAGTLTQCFLAGANGSRIDRIRFKAEAAGNNVATVARIFINNGSATGTTTTTYHGSILLPATTATANTDFQPDLDYVMNLPLPAGYKVYVALGTAVANGWYAQGIGGDY